MRESLSRFSLPSNTVCRRCNDSAAVGEVEKKGASRRETAVYDDDDDRDRRNLRRGSH